MRDALEMRRRVCDIVKRALCPANCGAKVFEDPPELGIDITRAQR